VRVESPNAPKLSDRLWEPAPAGTEREQAGAVRGATPAGAQVVAGGVTGAAPAAVASPLTHTPGWEAVRCSALLGDVGLGIIALGGDSMCDVRVKRFEGTEAPTAHADGLATRAE
jgi:hypothetical protein